MYPIFCVWKYQDSNTNLQGLSESQEPEWCAIDSLKVAGEALRFIRENGVSVTEFAEKIARYQRAHVSLALNHPIPMEKCRLLIKNYTLYDLGIVVTKLTSEWYFNLTILYL